MKLKTRLLIALGCMALLMLAVVISNIGYNRLLSKEIQQISQYTSPLAISAVSLETNFERLFNTIESAAIASREDLLRPLDSQENFVKKTLRHILSQCDASSDIVGLVDKSMRSTVRQD